MDKEINVHDECHMLKEWGMVLEFIRTMKKHMDEGQSWRIAIMGIVVTMLLQIGGFLYIWGQTTAIVKQHTKDIEETRSIASEEMKNINRKIDKVLYKIE